MYPLDYIQRFKCSFICLFVWKLNDSLCRSRTDKCSNNDRTERNYGEESDDSRVANRLELARIEVLLWLGPLWSGASITDQCEWDEEENYCATYATSVGYQSLWVPHKKHDNDRWNAENEGPEAFHATLVVIKQNFAATNFADPPFQRHNL